jgi:DNA polymerase III epsilon subunit-like protein
MSQIKICILDTETNGLPDGNDFSNINMLELGYIIMDIDMNILKKQNLLVKGNFKVPKIITELTGITKEMTNQNGRPLDYVLKEFYKDIKDCEFVIAHNMRFDYNVLKKELKTVNKFYLEEFCSKIQICSLAIFRKELPKPILRDHKLQTIYNYLYPEPYEQTHRALDDVFMIRNSFLKLNDFSLSYHYLNKNVNIGKYKGQKKTYGYILQNDFKYYNYMLKKIHRVNPSKIKYLCRFF